MGSVKEFEEKLIAFFDEHKKSKRFLVHKIATTFHKDEDIVIDHLHIKYKTDLGLKLIAEKEAAEQRKLSEEIAAEQVEEVGESETKEEVITEEPEAIEEPVSQEAVEEEQEEVPNEKDTVEEAMSTEDETVEEPAQEETPVAEEKVETEESVPEPVRDEGGGDDPSVEEEVSSESEEKKQE